MKIDNSEFIARHHKAAQPQVIIPPKRKDYGGVLTLCILCIFAGIFLFISISTQTDEMVRILAGFAFAFSIMISMVSFRFFQTIQKHKQELTLIHEVMEGSRGARLITDSVDNTIYFNQKFERMCRGVGRPSLETLTRLFQNDEGAAHFRLLADQAHRGLTDSIELFSKYEDRERWLMVTAQPVSGYAGYVHWRIDDVTQKHTVDRAIREEREKLIDFTDNAPVGFFSVDESGRFVFANATFARWVGEDLRVLLEQGFLHTYLEAPPQNAQPYDLVEDSRPRQMVEVRMKGAAGKTFLASINQVVVTEADGRVRTRAVVHDLTSEREMRQALKASEDRFQRFFEEAPLGIVQVDPKGKITDCNSAFASMLGISILDVEGRDFQQFLGDEDQSAFRAALDKIGQGQQMEAPLEIVLKADGRSIMTQMYARRFREGGSVVLHFIDRTEQKSLEEQFVQSQKMQAIGQLAGGVAHDFNNLLTAIIGFCDLLLLRHKPGDPSFGDIMQIKQNSNRAANLVRQLLAFSRQQTLRPRVQDVTDILTEVSHLLRRLIGASIDLHLVHGHELGLVKVDEGQMEQVLINLAVNARDAMNNVGKLIIETENFTNRKPKELVSEELPPGHWTVIKVIDTGCGIEKENMSRIFEPFFTTKEVGHGTGLGLATVYGIIRQTDGFLDVESEVGKGTTFTLYLPRATETRDEDADAQAAVVEDETQDLTGTERILLVEDEDAVRTFSQRALGNKGYEVLAAESGDSALGLMEQLENKHLDLLITDVVMPGMDGPTLAQRMRQNNPNLKIIFMSGYTEDRLKDYMGPNTFFLPKPFTLKQLAGKVKEVLGR
jgi:two-component system cell cycle sensor histidine kinase/response regulator CckA